jgi:hypothetical protein
VPATDVGSRAAPARRPLEQMHQAHARSYLSALQRSRHPLAPASAPACFAISRGRQYDLCVLLMSAPAGTRSAPAHKNAPRPHQKLFSNAPVKSAPAGTRLGTRVFCNKSWAPVRIPSSSSSLFILLIKRQDDKPRGRVAQTAWRDAGLLPDSRILRRGRRATALRAYIMQGHVFHNIRTTSRLPSRSWWQPLTTPVAAPLRVLAIRRVDRSPFAGGTFAQGPTCPHMGYRRIFSR